MFLDFIQNYPFMVAIVLGMMPALVWLFFWLKEDEHPEPAKMLLLAFLGGLLSIGAVLPLQKIVYDHLRDNQLLSFTLWASIEEISKFAFAYFIALRHKVTDEPVDDIIYLIVSALGFVTFENTLFLTELVQTSSILNTVISGNLRFIGASLIHIISSATIGVMLGLAFYKPTKIKVIYGTIGLLIAIVLHTAFNLFIISRAPGNIFIIFGFVWVGIVILLLLFEKIKHLRKQELKIKL